VAALSVSFAADSPPPDPYGWHGAGKYEQFVGVLLVWVCLIFEGKLIGAFVDVRTVFLPGVFDAP